MKKEFEYKYKAMGTDIDVSIICNNKNDSDFIYQEVLKSIDFFENMFSRFKIDSELSILNTKKDMIVSDQFLKALLKSKYLFDKTKGYFNPLMQISRYGYVDSFENIKQKKLVKEKYDIDFNKVKIDTSNNRVVLSNGQKFDFGGFLKGYVAEKMADKVIKYSKDISGVIINLGGDICTRGLDDQDKKFIFNIYNPVDTDKCFDLELFNESLATSGSYKRSWNIDNKHMHHILDKTGSANPQTEALSVSIIHKDGSCSEAYTKVFFSLEQKNAMELLKEEDIIFVFINKSGVLTTNI